MATNVQRTQAICDALINGVSTQAQQLELAEALYRASFGDTPFESLIPGQKAAIIPTYLRTYALHHVRQLREAKRPAIIDPVTDFPEGA